MQFLKKPKISNDVTYPDQIMIALALTLDCVMLGSWHSLASLLVKHLNASLFCFELWFFKSKDV